MREEFAPNRDMTSEESSSMSRMLFNATIHQDTILDAKAVSVLLRCSIDYAEELMREAKLPATKVGRGWITTYDQVVAFVRDRINVDSRRTVPIKVKLEEARPVRGRQRPLVPLPDITR